MKVITVRLIAITDSQESIRIFAALLQQAALVVSNFPLKSLGATTGRFCRRL